MKIAHLGWMPVAIIFCLVFAVILFRFSQRRNNWVYQYWMLQETSRSKIARLLVIVSVFLLAIALLDIRGPEEKVSLDVPEKKTMIIIDTSASMLVEDVTPNRFSRALLLARHFIRTSENDLKSIIVFSDQSKRIIPFTFDRDLLDSRLMAVEAMDIQSGGSNISLAINQAVQYLKAEQTENGLVVGNVLLITDGDEFGWENSSIEIPMGISLGVIGIGTAKGGKIPLRTRDGSFRGYKREGNEEVESKLNETYFESLVSQNKNAKYWIANSYSLPTDDIVAFFEKTFTEATSQADVSQRPVYGFPIIGLSLILILIASLLSMGKRFTQVSFIGFAIFLSFFLDQENVLANVATSEKAQRLVEKLSRGEADRREKLELAQELLQSGDYESSRRLYVEIEKEKGLSKEEKLNLGTAHLFSGDVRSGLDIYEKIKQENQAIDSTTLDMMRNNILAALQQKQEQEQQQENKSGQEEKKENERESENNEEQNEEGNNQTENQESSGSNGDQEQQSSGSEQNEEQEKKDSRNSNEDPLENDEQKPEGEQDSPVDQSDGSQKEVPALIQQIMSEDRKLQQDQLDMSTRDQRRTRGSKDW